MKCCQITEELNGSSQNRSTHFSTVEIDNDYVFVRRRSRLTSVKIDLQTIVSCSKSSKEDRVTVNYTKYTPKNEMVLAKQVIQGKPDLIRLFHQDIASKLNGTASTRPRRLLVFINPFAGRKMGQTIFQQMKPIFDCAQVKYETIVTSETSEVKQHLMESKELYSYDGVVAVGGDGTINGVVNGLMTRCQSDLKLDFENPANDQIPCLLPIGIIPAGTYNAFARYVHGTIDPTTAALHILLGQQVKCNVFSLHQDGRITTYTAIHVGFGMSANTIQTAEDLRCLGRYRYGVGFIMNLLRNHECLKLKISYKRFTLIDESICHSEHEWKTIEGDFQSVDSTLYNLEEDGMKTKFNIGENYSRLVLVQKCSRKDYYNYLSAYKNNKFRALENDFVKSILIKAVRIDISENLEDLDYLERLILSSDGEIVEITSNQVEIRLHPRVISIFGSRKRNQ